MWPTSWCGMPPGVAPGWLGLWAMPGAMGWPGGAPGCCCIPAGCGENEGPMLAIISQSCRLSTEWISTSAPPRCRMRSRARIGTAPGATARLARPTARGRRADVCLCVYVCCVGKGGEGSRRRCGKVGSSAGKKRESDCDGGVDWRERFAGRDADGAQRRRGRCDASEQPPEETVQTENPQKAGRHRQQTARAMRDMTPATAQHGIETKSWARVRSLAAATTCRGRRWMDCVWSSSLRTGGWYWKIKVPVPGSVAPGS